MKARRRAAALQILSSLFSKPRRLHLVEDSDGLIRCPIAGCDHTGFSSRRGCRKHAKTKHSWYYYFDEKPKLPEDKSLLTLADMLRREKDKKYRTVRPIMISHVPSRTGCKAVVTAENLKSSRTFR